MLCQQCPRHSNNLPDLRDNASLRKVPVPMAAKMRRKNHQQGLPSSFIAPRLLGLEAPISHGIKAREAYADQNNPNSNCTTLSTLHLQIHVDGRAPPPVDTITLDLPTACPALSPVRLPVAALRRKLGAGVIVIANLWAVCLPQHVCLRLMRLC